VEEESASIDLAISEKSHSTIVNLGRRVGMLVQFLVGGAASIRNIAIHALFMEAVIKVSRFEKAKLRRVSLL
jgi:hypothetical protein